MTLNATDAELVLMLLREAGYMDAAEVIFSDWFETEGLKPALQLAADLDSLVEKCNSLLPAGKQYNHSLVDVVKSMT